MTQVKAENRQHLVSLVEEHLKKHGYSCDLNHIVVSQITDLSFFFSESIFNDVHIKHDLQTDTVNVAASLKDS